MTSFAAARAQERPVEVALRDAEVALGWAEVDERLNRATNALLAESLGENRRIAVFADNCVESVLAHLCGLLAGTSVVPVNFHLAAEEVAYILEDSQTSVLFVGPETAKAGIEAARLAGVPTVIGWRCAGDPLTSWETWLSEAPADEPPTDHPPLPNLMYTSGTTGRPKGTELPPTMFAGGNTIAEHIERLAAGPFAQLGTHLVAGPLYHTGPLTGVRTLAGGVPVVVLGRFDAHATLAAIEQYQIQTSIMVPTHFVRLLALPESERRGYDLSSLKLGIPYISRPPARSYRS